MVVADQTDICWVVRIAKRKSPANPLRYLEEWQATLSEEVAGGTILSSTSEAGGSASFTVLPGFNPHSMARLIEEAIQVLSSQLDPINPNLTPRRIRRLRASFAKAVI